MAIPKSGNKLSVWGLDRAWYPPIFPESLPSDIKEDRIIVDGIEYVRADQLSSMIAEYHNLKEELYNSQQNPTIRLIQYMIQCFDSNTQQINKALQNASSQYEGTAGPIPTIMWFQKLYSLLDRIYRIKVQNFDTRPRESKLKCLMRHGYLPLVSLTLMNMLTVIRHAYHTFSKPQDKKEWIDKFFADQLKHQRKLQKSQQKTTP